MSKKQPKLTPWFPADVKPVHVGPYEVFDGSGSPAFAYWNGWRFGRTTITPETAAVWYLECSKAPGRSLKWRGLAVKP